MRNAWPITAAALSLAVVLAVGCDSTQPSHSSAHVASLTINASADVLLWDCYEVWTDQSNPPDGNPDRFENSFCELSTEPGQRSIPWNYSLRITVIRAGTTTEEVVTSVSGVVGSSIQPDDRVDDFISLTDYDIRVSAAAPKPPLDNIYYLNGQRVGPGSPVYLNANTFSLGTPNILTASPAFVFDVTSGDTIVVRARKQSLSQMAQFLPQDPDPNLLLVATMSVDGSEVVPAGSSASGKEDGSGFTFSFVVP